MKTYRDSRSLHKLFEDFSAEDVAVAMNDYAENMLAGMGDTDNVSVNKDEKTSDIFGKDEPILPQEAILNFLKNLEGIRINLKELHWNTRKTKTHNITSEFMSAIDEMQDEIAEDMQGFYKLRIQVGQLTPIAWHLNELNEIIFNTLQFTIVLKASIIDTRGLDGVVSILDEFMHKMNKYGYLEMMEC